jgi:hypothetical protein
VPFTRNQGAAGRVLFMFPMLLTAVVAALRVISYEAMKQHYTSLGLF